MYFQPFLITVRRKPILLVNTYIPPCGPNAQSIWTELYELLDRVLLAQPEIPFIIAGDLNSRLGPNNDTLAKFLNWDLEDMTPAWLSNARQSNDNFFNDNAHFLANLCSTYNLLILNGSPQNPCSGQFTFLSAHGSSVIDYILVSPEFLPLCGDLTIGTRAESDHLPLTILLSFPTSQNEPMETQQQTQLWPKWSPKINALFQQWTLNPEIVSLVDCLQSSMTPIQADSSYQLITKSLAELLRSARVPKCRAVERTWFDSECWSAKRLVRSLFLLMQFHNSTETKTLYFRAKQYWRQLFLAKIHNFAMHKWDQLYEAISTNNSKLFWHLITRSSLATPNSITPAITPTDWSVYYTNVFSTQYPLPELGKIPHDLPPWPPVTKDEILELILSLKAGKAPGPDGIANDLLINNANWWAAPLANLFTLIDQYGVIPDDWLISVLVPLLKKGDPSIPGNYRPISLLSSIGKLYSKHLLTHLISWTNEKNLPGPEQIGFRPGSTTLDHALILTFLAEKYSIHFHGHLFVAFIDLKAAFDSVNRHMLWEKLAKWGMPSRLLFLLRKLHSSNFCQVRFDHLGSLSDNIPVNRGVRQGCILAPYLFNLFLADLRPQLSPAEKSAPLLNRTPIPLLLYADDAVLLSVSSSGLRHLLGLFHSYCLHNNLAINYDKSKILVFAKSWKPLYWEIANYPIEQVKCFKYLGIYFHFRLKWVVHRNQALASSDHLIGAISKFHYISGNQYVPAALHIFKCKLISRLLYGVPIWINALSKSIDQLASKFYRRILGVPNNIKLSTLTIELGMHLPSTTAWKLTLKFWLRLYFKTGTDSLLELLLNDPFEFSWSKTCSAKLTSIGITLDSLYNCNFSQAFDLIQEKLWEAEHVDLISNLNQICSPYHLGIFPSLDGGLSYFQMLVDPKERRAFMLARLNIFPSEVLDGRYAKVPLDQRICKRCGVEPDTVTHILCVCPGLQSIRNLLLGHIISMYSGPPHLLARYLLRGFSKNITSSVAEFLTKVLSVTVKK